MKFDGIISSKFVKIHQNSSGMTFFLFSPQESSSIAEWPFFFFLVLRSPPEDQKKRSFLMNFDEIWWNLMCIKSYQISSKWNLMWWRDQNFIKIHPQESWSIAEWPFFLLVLPEAIWRWERKLQWNAQFGGAFSAASWVAPLAAWLTTYTINGIATWVLWKAILIFLFCAMEGNSDICEGWSSKVTVAVTVRNSCCSVLWKAILIFVRVEVLKSRLL